MVKALDGAIDFVIEGKQYKVGKGDVIAGEETEARTIQVKPHFTG